MNSNETASCVNCGAKKYTMRTISILEQWPAALALFTEWLSPYVLKENDFICKFCIDHAQYKIRQLVKTGQITDETQSVPSSILSQIENRKVCVMCAVSLFREKRSMPVLCSNGPEKYQLASDLICQAVLLPHKKINADSQVCRNCWMRKLRQVERMQSDLAADQASANNLNYTQDHDHQYSLLLTPNHQYSTSEECIELPNYRRSPDISTHCIFENCTSEDLHSISDELRVTIIKHHHYLVTAEARVCHQHLLKNEWVTLFKAKNSISTFRPDHIEHVLSFVGTSKCTGVDFNDILNLDNNIVEYFLGISKESFSVILKTLPELKGVENGVFGLMGLLLRYWNGGPISKVAGLLKICPKTLEIAMTNVTEILRCSPVTVNMGIEYLLKTNK